MLYLVKARALELWDALFTGRLIALAVLLLALTGCASQPPAPSATPGLPEASLAATPLPTQPVVNPCAYPAAGRDDLLCETPGTTSGVETQPWAEMQPYPYPAVVEPLVPVSTPAEQAAAVSTDYRDCARTPGLVGCDPGAPAVPGRLAFYDSAVQRLVRLDLNSGQGWQAPVDGPPAGLDWAPGGGQLLASLGGERYAVYQAGGAPVEAFTTEPGQPAPAWQGDTLVKNGAVIAADGTRAWITQDPGGNWELQIGSELQAEKTIALDSSKLDQLYFLRAWVPGKRWVLIQSVAGGSAALMQGADLMVMDADSGELLPVENFTPLDDDAFVFNPARGALLALILSNGVPAGPDAFRRLALYDFDTAQKRYPLPDGAVVSGMAWRPDGERLAITVPTLPDDTPAELRALFPGAGIYLLDPQSGTVEPITAAPASAVDGWPQWSTDGTFLIYGRAITLTSGEQILQVRSHRMDDGAEWVLVDGLPAPRSVAGRISWQRFLSFGGQ